MCYSRYTIDYFEPWLEFRHPLVRQLAFCIASPDILNELPAGLELIHKFDFHNEKFWQDQFKQYYPRLLQLDSMPEPLLSFLNRLKSTRLGLRFEYLLWFWLQDQDYHPFQLIGHSIQKIQGARTLGELDFLLFNKETGHIEHWEVALKFYLGEHDLSLPYWFGLNREDTLYKKLSHFTQQQFQFQSALEHPIQQRYAVLKGQLYLPETCMHSSPVWINRKRRTGTWGTKIKKNLYRLSRHEWLCPDQRPSSSPAYWWTNGLYLHFNHPAHYYMYRQNSKAFN